MNIHPTFDQLISRKDRERRLNQRSKVLWFTGLSGSGKSTIAIALEKLLFQQGYFAQVLDGDNIRSGINNNLDFSEEDRIENIRRIAEVSKLFLQAGVITLNCFISPTKAMREMARQIIGEDDFVEIYISTLLAVCEQRDVKGLYSKARRGEITNFTGIHEPFEVPEKPALIIDTHEKSVDSCTALLYEFILPSISYLKH
jgi:adenylylsulfate kinase